MFAPRRFECTGHQMADSPVDTSAERVGMRTRKAVEAAVARRSAVLWTVGRHIPRRRIAASFPVFIGVVGIVFHE